MGREKSKSIHHVQNKLYMTVELDANINKSDY